MQLQSDKQIRLDEKDKVIIEQLQLNCRQSIARIAKTTKLPRDVVVYRIKKLEQNNVIRSYHAMLNPHALGYPLYVYVLFSCNNISPQKEAEFITYMRGHKQIIYVAKNSGQYDFTIGICAKNYIEFDAIIQKIRHEFPETIKEFDISPTVQEYKFDWMADMIDI